LYVLARFLDKLYENGRLKKTNLQMRVGLNYPRFIEYLDWLVSHGLVQQTDEGGAELYSLSSQGLDAHRRLVAWIRETMKGMRI
jgi:predicted transcriptional regulator